MQSYKTLWIKNGIVTKSRPSNFDFLKDSLFIIGCGNIIFPHDCTNLHNLPPDPNMQYDSRELFDSLINLCNQFNKAETLEKQLKKAIKWCEKFGLPFFGDNGLYCGSISTCIKITGEPIGFNFKTFFHDVHALYDTFYKACYIDVELQINDKAETIETLNVDLSEDDKMRILQNKKDAICSSLNIAMLQKQQRYIFSGDTLVCETGFKTLLSLAYHQLAILLLSPKGMSAKRCKQCGALFATTNNKKDFCSIHSPQSFYSMRKRTTQLSHNSH